MKQFSPEFCSQNKMLVLSDSDESVTIGILDDADESLRSRIENSIQRTNPGKKMNYSIIPEPELMLAISSLETVSMTQNDSRFNTSGLTDSTGEYEISTIENGAPVITVLNSILLDAKNRGASDIHLEREKNEISVRIRVDGVLRHAHRFDAHMGRSLSVRIKLMANLNTLETRKPQDGRFSITDGKFDHDIRVSIVPSVNGESIVLRFLDTGETEISLQRLGFSSYVYAALEKIPARPNGLVLVTGPTGSGKTTTLSSIVRNCDLRKRKIISIEDPVEYRISGVTQIQTNENLGLDFGVLLKRILRQDPDVLMIGEIRDTETAELSIRAALTGHLVLSTLHTRTALEAETRLIDMGIPGYLLKTVLCEVINQRLVRKTCLICRGSGCTVCSGSGYSGRLPVAEIYIPSDKNVVRSMRSLMDEADDLINSGLTDRSEIKRVLGEYA